MLTGVLTLALAGGLASPSSAHAHRGHATLAHYERAHLSSAHHERTRRRVPNDERTHASAHAGGSGLASVYSGGRTANGEHMSGGAMTAAHRTLAFGTHVTVTNRTNGRSVVVRINDRGPFVHGRVIDLSPAAASAIGISGLAPVALSVGSRRRSESGAQIARE